MIDHMDRHLKHLEAVDTLSLTPLVQEALGDAALSITDWKYEPVTGGFGGAAGPSLIYRFRGTCTGKTRTWSLILKIVLARKDEAPADPKYWRREYELYRTGLLDELPPGIVAPRGYGVTDFPGELTWIWMEDVQGEVERPLPASYYERVGRHFGQFNGAYLAGSPIPTSEWLSVNWMDKMVAWMHKHNRPSVIYDSLTHPLLKRHFPTNAVERYAQLWDEREIFLNALSRLPHTFAHQDTVNRNLFSRQSTANQLETVAVDWAFAGQAAVGLDAAMAIVLDIFLGDLEASQAETMDTIIFETYLEGLRDAGWQGDEQQVRLGYTASTALKYLELINALEILTNEDSLNWFSSEIGKPADYLINQMMGMHEYAHKRADEARTLMQTID